jgi:hypothetical protein
MKRKQYYLEILKSFSNNKLLTNKEKDKLYVSITKDIYKLFGEKSGKFAENVCREEIESCGYKLKTKDLKVENLPGHIKKDFYRPDGLIEELNVYVESKNYMFYSTGTANEKLPGFLIKLQYYDKPCVLILSGLHEMRSFDECNIIYGSYNEEEEYKNEFLYPVITKLKRQKKLYVTGLSSLKETLEEIKNDKNNS